MRARKRLEPKEEVSRTKYKNPQAFKNKRHPFRRVKTPRPSLFPRSQYLLKEINLTKNIALYPKTNSASFIVNTAQLFFNITSSSSCVADNDDSQLHSQNSIQVDYNLHKIYKQTVSTIMCGIIIFPKHKEKIHKQQMNLYLMLGGIYVFVKQQRSIV